MIFGATKIHTITYSTAKPHQREKERERESQMLISSSLVPSVFGCIKNTEDLVSFLMYMTSRVERW